MQSPFVVWYDLQQSSPDNVHVDKMMKKLLPKIIDQGLHAQLKHWKTVSKGGIPKDLFYLTKAGKKLSVNLKKIIQPVIETPDIEPQVSTSKQCDKEKIRDKLKQKFLAKKKRKGPVFY